MTLTAACRQLFCASHMNTGDGRSADAGHGGADRGGDVSGVREEVRAHAAKAHSNQSPQAQHRAAARDMAHTLVCHLLSPWQVRCAPIGCAQVSAPDRR
jgi:hypothetical protein